MNRNEIRKRFGTSGPVILPVIHVLDTEQTTRNMEIAIAGGCPGVFLINHDFEYQKLLPIIRDTRHAFPEAFIGANFIAVTGKYAFPVLGQLQSDGIQVNAYWADDARIDERTNENTQTEANEIAEIRAASGWDGLYFGGTAFKKQRPVEPEHFGKSAQLAANHMDVVTTSGLATGIAADLTKIEQFRENCGDTALAVASGITLENLHLYQNLVDAFLVATGINFDEDFYNIDPQRLSALMKLVGNIEIGRP